MKTMKCDCGYVIKGITEKEVMDKMWEHMKRVHSDQIGETMKMSKEEKNKIMDEEKKKIENE